jgi:hypoxanthine-DNA glycosylase
VASKTLKGLPPIIDARARVMILGSFPSAASLAAQQYYAHKQNQFWKILGEILARPPLYEMAYAERTRVVLDAGIAIWDVYATCERSGSLDSAIRNGQPNDFAKLKKSALAGRHELPRVCFNGQAAGRFAPQLEALGFETLILPSTSPANATWNFARKLEAWRNGLAV